MQTYIVTQPIESPRAHWLRRDYKTGSPLLAVKIFNLLLHFFQ
jgi:hypothetical protein